MWQCRCCIAGLKVGFNTVYHRNSCCGKGDGSFSLSLSHRCENCSIAQEETRYKPGICEFQMHVSSTLKLMMTTCDKRIEPVVTDGNHPTDQFTVQPTLHSIEFVNRWNAASAVQLSPLGTVVLFEPTHTHRLAFKTPPYCTSSGRENVAIGR